MREPMLGHLDPVFHDRMLELIEMLQAVYGAHAGVTLPLQATGMSGMETGIVNLVSPGDVVIVGYAGFFGHRIAEMAARHGAEVVEVTRDWGETVPNEALLEALDRRPEARLVAVVHAETSTGAQHPLEELGAALRDRDTLLFADCVTSLGGIPLAFDDWGVDFAYSCTQKALGAPPGMSPIAFSPRALERARERTGSVPFSFDIELLLDYWVKRPITYHHTAPILHIYALYQGLRHALEEGLEARWARHEEAGRYLQAAGPRPRVRPARGPGPPATAPDRGARARRLRRPGRAAATARRVRHRGRRRAGTGCPGDVAHRADGAERVDVSRRSRPGGVRRRAGRRAGARPLRLIAGAG